MYREETSPVFPLLNVKALDPVQIWPNLPPGLTVLSCFKNQEKTEPASLFFNPLFNIRDLFKYLKIREAYKKPFASFSMPTCITA
jgi:hypothetical protein